MLPFENVVCSYIKKTHNHVMYRVTPKFEGKELIARGVQIEALSVEDNGRGIKFNVFIKNEQPGIGIDYKTGYNWRVDKRGKELKRNYIINVHTKKIHTRQCCGADKKYKTNKKYRGCKSKLLYKGYKVCKNCNPE
jgi:DNA-entry nuclease